MGYQQYGLRHLHPRVPGERPTIAAMQKPMAGIAITEQGRPAIRPIGRKLGQAARFATTSYGGYTFSLMTCPNC